MSINSVRALVALRAQHDSLMDLWSATLYSQGTSKAIEVREQIFEIRRHIDQQQKLLDTTANLDGLDKLLRDSGGIRIPAGTSINPNALKPASPNPWFAYPSSPSNVAPPLPAVQYIPPPSGLSSPKRSGPKYLIHEMIRHPQDHVELKGYEVVGVQYLACDDEYHYELVSHTDQSGFEMEEEELDSYLAYVPTSMMFTVGHKFLEGTTTYEIEEAFDPFQSWANGNTNLEKKYVLINDANPWRVTLSEEDIIRRFGANGRIAMTMYHIPNSAVSPYIYPWTPSPSPEKEKKCECGADKSGSAGHSTWCVMYDTGEGEDTK